MLSLSTQGIVFIWSNQTTWLQSKAGKVVELCSVLHFRKWSIEQPGLLVFSAKSKSLKPLVLSFTLKGLLTWKEVLCECAVMDKNVEKWNMEMGEDVFPGGWWNMQRKLLKIKNEKKVGGRRTISRNSFFPPFLAEDVCTLSTCTTLLKVGHRYPSLSRTLPNLLLFFFCYTSLPLAPFILSL